MSDFTLLRKVGDFVLEVRRGSSDGDSPPAPVKQIFAIEIMRNFPVDAREIAAVESYARTDPKKLTDLYGRWRDGHKATGTLLPPEGTTQGVNEVVVADIFIDFMRNSDQDGSQKKSALEAFNKIWMPATDPIRIEAVYRGTNWKLMTPVKLPDSRQK